MRKNKKIVIFSGQKIRRTWNEKKELWYFSVVKFLANERQKIVLSESVDKSLAKVYI